LIRAGDRNVFIAECKFWSGTKSFVDALDQLFGYLTWRDTKSALIVFNRNRDASGVITKMHDAMKSHPSYRRTLSFGPEGRSEYIFVKESDPGREMRVTTLLFDLSD
jgi:hypothetical protein